MFTGLVEEVGRVVSVDVVGDGGRRMQIEASPELGELEIGESIAVDGCCLTVTERADEAFSVDVSVETCDCTTLGSATEGTEVHLERALRAGDRLGGHFVQGHVDGVGTIRSRRPDGEGWRVEIDVPSELRRYLIAKGSVAVDGVSLTVNRRTEGGFSVMIVPHTAEKTKLGEVEAGREVNIEVDMLGKYVERLLQYED